jgi:hypothetical protein
METNKKYRVFVDDNYHYMDESERHEEGSYESLPEAIEACKRITRNSLKEMYGPDITPEKLSALWSMFGEDPFTEGDGEVPFSARKYITDELCAEIIAECMNEIAVGYNGPNGMIYSIAIQKAVRFSMKTHEVYQKQKRKGKDIPYITHPLTVGLILARAGADENTIVAGILHDTMEDSIPAKKVTREMIEERFGAEAALLVESVTETKRDLPWADRKQEALEHIKTFSNNSVLLKSADVISNTSEILADFETNGEEIFTRFNASKADLLGNYIRTMTALIEKWSDSPLVGDLELIREKLNALLV